MCQQQKQIQDLILRTSAVDLRTERILTVVESPETPVVNSRVLVQRQLPTPTSITNAMLAPSTLQDLCDQQQIVNSWLRRKRRLKCSAMEQSLLHCTCVRKPQFPSRNFFSTFSLHDESCALHVEGQQAVAISGSYTFCNRFLGLSVQVMMTLTRGAGAFTISPIIRMQAVVCSDSPAFNLIESYNYTEYSPEEFSDIFKYITATLLQMFSEGAAAPTDRLQDGSTILHSLASSALLFIVRYKFFNNSQMGSCVKSLVRALLNAGVPFNERTFRGCTTLDLFIHTFYYNDRRDPWLCDWRFDLLELLFDSGGYLNSPAALKDAGTWNDLSSQAARLLLPNNTHGLYKNIRFQTQSSANFLGFEFLEVEIAILSRSAHSLEHCLSTRDYQRPNGFPASQYFVLLHLSLGWPEGLITLLESPLRHSLVPDPETSLTPMDPIGKCFVQACYRGNDECALILLQYLRYVVLDHLRAAAWSNNSLILKKIISGLAISRHDLQQLALRYLPQHILSSFSLSSDALLNTKASDIYTALNDHGIKVQDPYYRNQSVYQHATHDIATFKYLYEAGFTDFNQCCGESLISHVDLRFHISYPQDPWALIGCADWLICRGASLYQHSTSGYPTPYYLANSFGGKLQLSIEQHHSGDITTPARKTQLTDSAGFLCRLIADDTEDHCVCACSNGACNPLQQVLRGLFIAMYSWGYTEDIRRLSIGGFSAVLDLLLTHSPEPVSEDQKLRIFKQVIRYLTFVALGLSHTCHKCDCRYFIGIAFEKMDPEEIQEIREEEALLIDQLNDLVTEFSRKFEKLRTGIQDFIEAYWMPRMDEVLANDEPDLEEEQRVREIGVIITPCNDAELGHDG
ncbi:hypothetical protein BJY04DRAFT_43414 [Aspergillus karnatakaensis]|uniref:uncharacterized protein n=1 Tax=Aspergillus karnatakaensis TaxID=1810916 RepID=UPI003CCDC832